MKNNNESEVDGALPIVGEADEFSGSDRDLVENRESMIYSGADETEPEDDDDSVEPPDSRRSRLSKLRVLGVVAGFAAGLAILATGVSWFFGIGSFAEMKKQNVDRTAKTSQGGGAPPVSEDEKLRLALNMVAEKSASSPVPLNVSNQTSASISPNEPGPEQPSLALPGETIPIAAVASPKPENQTAPSRSSGGGGGAAVSPTRNTAPINSPLSRTSTPLKSEISSREEQEKPVSVRSIYFGTSPEANEPQTEADETSTPIISSKPESSEPVQLPFGAFLPVRILGAIYAVRNSGSLVRMELTRSVEAGDGVELPAGTVIVGRVKESELNRVLVGVIGLIDPSTGGLVTFEGELVGGDGAAGVAGKRRSVKSGWAKFLGGLRDAGATAIGAIGGRRSGTVVIADRAAGSVSGDVAEIIRRERAPEYVEVSAGTTAFVLVTQLPNEISESFRIEKGSQK